MSCANMSVVRGAVVKGFATGCASKRPFSSLFVVRFQVTSKVFLFPKLFLATGGFIRFLTSMDLLVSNEMIGASKGLAAGVTTMLFTRLFGWWRVTIPGLNFL